MCWRLGDKFLTGGSPLQSWKFVGKCELNPFKIPIWAWLNKFFSPHFNIIIWTDLLFLYYFFHATQKIPWQLEIVTPYFVLNTMREAKKIWFPPLSKPKSIAAISQGSPPPSKIFNTIWKLIMTNAFVNLLDITDRLSTCSLPLPSTPSLLVDFYLQPTVSLTWWPA